MEPPNPPRQKVRDGAEARELLVELAKSDLTLSTFCRDRGLCGRSLQAWKLIVSRASWLAQQKPAPPCDPLRLVEVVASKPTIPPPATPLAVHIGDVVVDVFPGFDADTLARVVQVLRR